MIKLHNNSKAVGVYDQQHVSMKKKYSVDSAHQASLSSSYSPPKSKMSGQYNATHTNGFQLALKQTPLNNGSNLAIIYNRGPRDKSPMACYSPQNQSYGIYQNTKEQRVPQTEIKFPEINTGGINNNIINNKSFTSEKIPPFSYSLSSNRKDSYNENVSNEQKISLKIHSKNVALLDPYSGQPNFLRPIGQTKW